MEPPGWIHDVAPASIAEIKPSAKGNIASLATELPSKDRPASPAFQIAIRHESTLDICPAPIPNVLSLPLKTIAFDLMSKTNKKLSVLGLKDKSAGFYKKVDNLPPSSNEISNEVIKLINISKE